MPANNKKCGCQSSIITRGTTPTHTFCVDADLSEADVLYITYRQKGKVVIEKNIEDVEIETNKITVSLTQDDTLLLLCGIPVRIQIRAGFPDGTRIASNIIEVDAGEILKDGEI